MRRIFRFPILNLAFLLLSGFIFLFSIFSTRSIVTPMENYTWNLGQLDREVLMASVLLQRLIEKPGNPREAITWLQFSSSRLDTLQNGVLREDFNDMVELARDFEQLHNTLDRLISQLENNPASASNLDHIKIDVDAIVPLARRIASLGIAAVQRKEVNDIYALRERSNITLSLGLLMVVLSVVSLYVSYRDRIVEQRNIILEPVYKALFSSVLDDILRHTPVTYVSTTLSGVVISAANTSSYDVKYWKNKNLLNQNEKFGYKYDPDLKEIHRLACRFNSWYGPFTRKGVDKKVSYGLLKVTRITDRNTDILHWVFTDITDQEVARSKAIVSERFAAIGEVASGIAHEVNQPLNVMSLVVENIRRHCLGQKIDPSYLDQKINLLGEQIKRAAYIIEKMRFLSYGQLDKFSVFSLAEAINYAVEQSADEIKRIGITLEVSTPQECCFLYGEEWATRQVFANIIGNSIDAMRESGDIKRLKIESCLDGSEICVMVTDSGPGIDETLIERVFEPFFSTKGLGSGSGLGLPICRSLMQRQGGTIHAEAVSGGARFILRFQSPDRAIP